MILFDAAAFISCVSNPSVEPVERMGCEQSVHISKECYSLSQFFPAIVRLSEFQCLFIMSVSEFAQPQRCEFYGIIEIERGVLAFV